MSAQTPVALVTGARRGIGLGIARALADAGYRVLLSAASPRESAQDVLSALPGDCDYLSCDISRAEQRAALFDAVRARYGRLDLLVNNAGVGLLRRTDILETTVESVERLLHINLEGTFFMCQAGARLMLDTLGLPDYHPRIVNIGSISAYTASTSRGEYCLSKAGVGMVTALFADRLAAEGIGVFEIRPGIIDTDMIAAVRDSYEARIAAGLLPQRRLGRPEDVAACVMAIAEGRLDYCTGQVLDCDGGFHLRRL